MAQEEDPPKSPTHAYCNLHKLLSGGLKTQHTGSAVFVENRQKPEADQTHKVTATK